MSDGQWLRLGLLLRAYLGSNLVSGRAIRGFGLPSGSEYLVLGFALAFGLREIFNKRRADRERAARRQAEAKPE